MITNTIQPTPKHQALVGTLSPTFSHGVAAPNIQLTSSGTAKLPAREITPPPRSHDGRRDREEHATSLSPKFSARYLALVAPTKRPHRPFRKKAKPTPITPAPFLLPALQNEKEEVASNNNAAAAAGSSSILYQILEEANDQGRDVVSLSHPETGQVIATMLRTETAQQHHPIGGQHDQRHWLNPLWTIYDANTGSEVAFVVARHHHRHDSDPTFAPPVRTSAYRVYAKTPLYDGQEKMRRQHGHGSVLLLYHWADLQTRPSGILGRTMEQSMTVKVGNPEVNTAAPYHEVSYRLGRDSSVVRMKDERRRLHVDKRRRQTSESDDEDIIAATSNGVNSEAREVWRTSIQNSTPGVGRGRQKDCCMLEVQKRPNEKRVVLTVDSDTDPLLMSIFLVLMGRIHD